MNLDFAAAIAALGGPSAMFTIANQVRPASAYLGNTLLPERNKPTFAVNSGNMTIRTTMAGLAAMDSPYPPSGLAEASSFSEQTAKIANHVILTEQALRTIQELLLRATGTGRTLEQILGPEVLNFYNKVVLQAHLDTMEMLRWQALADGALAWEFNGITLSVDYGIPDANIITPRTDSANDAYFDSGSLFWTDHRAALAALHYNVAAVIMSTPMFQVIVDNPVNNIEVLSQNGNIFEVRRYVSRAGGVVNSSDARDRITFVTYDLEGEFLNPATPGTTTKRRFLPIDKIVYVGRPTIGGYRVGEGATPDPESELALGYTHLGPTIEGGGAEGRWGEVFTPQGQPYQLHGRGVTNGLPVLENPELVVILESELD